ncbi:DUF5677 domain-containing protein [Pseudomonas sp. B22129]|uniref:DUF5677 domain-containing protein n=1 Tax=Pseudomonas sp. B22129 TaxID=3235111 RepID=UPI00378388A4
MIDLKQDALTITHFNQQFDALIGRHKEAVLSGLGNDPQRIIIRHYLNVLVELSQQGCRCLHAKAFSTLEALSRVIMEQSANLLYIGMDAGDNALALLRSSKQMTAGNGKAWAAYLDSQGAHNPAARARQANGEAMLAHFDERWPKVERYPGGKGLFTALGWENHYHAFYAPLCDSVHSYSDDMSALVGFGDLFVQSPSEGEQLLRYWDKERRRLATYHYAIALGLRAEASIRLFNLLTSELEDDAADAIFKPLSDLIKRHDQFDHGRLDGMKEDGAVFGDFAIKT